MSFFTECIEKSKDEEILAEVESWDEERKYFFYETAGNFEYGYGRPRFEADRIAYKMVKEGKFDHLLPQDLQE